MDGGWTGGWMNRWMDGWMDEQVDAWMDGWVNRWMDKCTSSVKVRNPSVMLPFNSFTTLLSCHSSLKRISQKTGKFKKNYNKILQKCLILEEIAMMTSQTENLFHINAALKKKNQFQY